MSVENRKSMTAMPYLPMTVKPSLEVALKDSVVLSWNELMPSTPNGVINVEYHTGPEHLLEYLKVWASSERGYWTMICEYWKSSIWSNAPGMSFGKGYGPGGFSKKLENVMQHENDFDKGHQQDTLIQISSPNLTERNAAENRKETLIG